MSTVESVLQNHREIFLLREKGNKIERDWESEREIKVIKQLVYWLRRLRDLSSTRVCIFLTDNYILLKKSNDLSYACPNLI